MFLYNIFDVYLVPFGSMIALYVIITLSFKPATSGFFYEIKFGCLQDGFIINVPRAFFQ